MMNLQINLWWVPKHVFDAKFNDIERAVAKSARDCEADMRQSILARPTQYKPYIRAGRGIHWSSFPGYPPNNDYGLLANTLKTKKIARGTYEVSANQPYAIDLEFGSANAAPRPFMLPALRRQYKPLRDAIMQILTP